MKKNIIAIITLMVTTFVLCFGTIEMSYASGDYSYEYKTEYSKWITKWSSYKPAGNQKSQGYHFASGKGGFYWSDSGGPTASISYSPGGIFSTFSISVGLGKNSSQGVYTAIGDNPSYVKKHMYKLYVKKKVKAREYKNYKRLKKKGAKWKCYYTGHQSETLCYSLDARCIGEYK